MGRWAQRRIRGGGGVVPTPPTPPILPTISEIDFVDARHVQVFFTDNVSFDTGTAGDANLTIGPAQPTGALSAIGSSSCVVETDGDVGVNDGWFLTAQPIWILTPLSFPNSGLVN